MEDPDRDCSLCPRLRGFILDNRRQHPDWHNGPVPTWHPPEGPTAVRLLIVGLAPGLRGANRTGRPFTGDDAGTLLFATLGKYGLATGHFDASADASMCLEATAITNAVRCVPPENRPVGSEINTCRTFLSATITGLPRLEIIVTLGKISHDSTVRALGGRLAEHPFVHAAETELGGRRIVSSYHCSRYNTHTGRLTPAMFEAVFAKVTDHLSAH